MSNPKITLIVAAAENNVIGKNNQMPWHLPNDFKHFKKNTIGHSVLMGRKTFESIGKALPERRNIVITSNHSYQAEDIDVANSIDEALLFCRDEHEVFIIGGAEIFRETIGIADKILFTRVYADPDGDTFFPNLEEKEWELESVEKHQADEKHAYDYSFETYNRIS